MRFTATTMATYDALLVEIDRGKGEAERLVLERSPAAPNVYLSTAAPAEPHEFSAQILWAGADHEHEAVNFSMKEPSGHHDQGHEHLDDVAHAEAHAATLPEYVKNGERPRLAQIVLFGAAGGMIPCPASITVMLLALSTGRTGLGLLTVLGFSLGLAAALVGIGIIVVTGLSKLSNTGRFSSISRKAPIISAGLVIVSGLFALLIAH